MGDFPPQWKLVRDLPETGQSYTFVVRRAGDDAGDPEYVLKRLKNPKREEYFNREIQTCKTLNHPNILKIVEDGRTPQGRPFLVTEYCSQGSLKFIPEGRTLGQRLRFFAAIVSGVAYAHLQEHPVYHLDIKPENILLKAGKPLVGDWGICFIENGEVTLTKEGPRGSAYYCAPELRGPRIPGGYSLGAADVYSLGKVLYFLFTGEVYDGHEEEYDEPSRRLNALYPSDPQMAIIDSLVARTVRRKPFERLQNASELLAQVRRAAERIEAGGRVLDVRIPQRCLYCAEGKYRPVHDQINISSYSRQPKFPPIEERRTSDNVSYPEQSRYASLREAAQAVWGVNKVGVPVMMICDFCGNIQYFRLDIGQDPIGKNWLP